MPGVFRGGRPRRRPWPKDCVLDGTPLMLLRPPGPPDLRGVHPNPVAAAQPTEMDYSAQSPLIEATEAYEDLVEGFGQRVQTKHGERRYRFTSNMDCSIGRQFIFGPYITSVTPTPDLDSTNGFSSDGAFEMTVAGTKKLFALNGRYCLVRNGDSAGDWDTSKDFGSGKVSKHVVVHSQNTSTGGTTYAYVAMGDSEFIWRYDASSDTATWTQHASLYALCWAKSGKHLYRAHSTNLVSRVDTNADPWTATNWSSINQFRVGDATSAIIRMVVHPDGLLYIFKTDGIYVLDEEGDDTQLFSGLKFSPNSDNGLYNWVFENWIHTTYGGQHYRIGPGGSIEPIGPERFASNDSPVSGYVTAGISHYSAICGLYNPNTSDSHLLKFGAYPAEFEGDPQRIDAWHGSLASVAYTADGSFGGAATNTFDNTKITNIFRTTCGASAAHERAYIFTSTGAVYWFLLNNTINPLADSAYQYWDGTNGKSGLVLFPHWHGGFVRDEKVIRGFTLTASYIGTTATFHRLWVKTVGVVGDPTAYGASSAYTVPGTRFTVNRTVTLANLGVSIIVTATDAATVTPVFTSFALHYRVNPQRVMVWELVILAEDGLVDRSGTPLRIGADRIRSVVQTAYADTNGVALILPDEETVATVQLTNYEEGITWDSRARKYRSTITVQAVTSVVTESLT